MAESQLSHRSTGTQTVDYKIGTTSLVPTLYIGLGGTGRNVLLNFRKALYDEYGNCRPKCCRFLVIDTDEQQKDSLEDGEALVSTRLQSDKGEFIGCNISVAKYDATMSSFEDKNDRRYKSWLHPNFRKLVPPANMSQGAGTYRQAGRLAFFMQFPTIRDQVTRHLENMFDEAAEAGLEVFPGYPATVDTKSLEVVIVTSLAGGTGSGAFIDMAYLVQDLITRQVVQAVKDVASHITLVAFLPTIYARKHPTLASRFRQNAYASLLEMEHYSTFRPEDSFGDAGNDTGLKGVGGEFRVNWSNPTGTDQIIRRRPWDTCYLIDDINDRQPGKIRQADELYQMVADYLFLDFGDSPFAIAKRSARSNHRQLIDRRVQSTVLASFDNEDQRKYAEVFDNRYGSTFSSFGLAEIVIDQERINRAASYRLAVSLISRRWIGKSANNSGEQYKAWAKSDLKDGDPPLGNPERIPFGPENLWTELSRSGGIDWLQRLTTDLSRLAGRDDPAALAKYLADCGAALERDGTGVDAAPRQTMDRRLQEFIGHGANLGSLRQRLQQLTRVRFQELGTSPMMELLRTYQAALKACTDLTGKWRTELAGLPSDTTLMAKVRDSLHVKFPCRGVAIARTYSWAIDDAQHVLKERYRRKSLDFLDRIYGELQKYVGSGQQKEDGLVPSLMGHYRGIEHFLRDVEATLTDRYDHFSHHAGNDLKISLLPDWKDEDYDHEINLALMRHEAIGAGSSSSMFDWTKAEKEILNHLFKGVPQRAQSFPDLIDHWMEQRGLNDDALKQIVEDIARACRLTLGDGIDLKNFANGNVVNYLSSKPEDFRKSTAKQLVDAAAPYLPATNAARIENFRLCCRNILGRKGGDGPGAASNVKRVESLIGDVAVAGARDQLLEEIHDTKDLRPTRLALVRELAGFPLCLYSRLRELEDAYFDTQLKDQRQTCHIKWRETYEDLPDILLVEDDEYRAIREYVDYVFRGIFLRFIECGPDGMFCVKISSPTVGEQVIPLGLRVNRIVKHACDKPEVREFLKRSWQRWSSEKSTPTHFAVLYNALQQSRQLIQQRRKSTEPLPSLNCIYRLMESTADDLKKTDEGQRWYALLRDRDSFDDDFDQWRDVRFPEVCRYIREACLTLADEELLPIYQINLKKVDAVLLSGAGG
ncbi:MAG: hypothetical protein NTZ32_01100 [Planctomycetales bacterium]|nr:hypothetical protein [Planctomycetales bacterium]